MPDLVYLDASALVKLVVVEPETRALRSYLADQGRSVTSLISRVEVSRALLRRDVLDAVALDELWARVNLLPVDLSTAEAAARLGPPTLRSLDAVHLVSALSLVPDLGPFVTYDARLADAARAIGLRVVAPR